MAKKFRRLLLGILFGSALGCSSGSQSCLESRTCSPAAPEQPAGNDSGAAGFTGGGRDGGGGGSRDGGGGALGRPSAEAGAGGVSTTAMCVSDAECDDHLRCNGVETCRGGECQTGVAICENASKCVEGPSATVCTYQDSSAWLVYEADEDTPAVDELYAVKESLMGVQHPIKISAPLPHAPGEQLARYSFSWSADGRWLMFGTTEKKDTSATRYYAVRFDRGTPEAPVALTSGLPAAYITWSPTGHELLFLDDEGNLFWIHLKEDGAVATAQLNPNSHQVRDMTWVTGSKLVYITKDGEAYRLQLDSDVPQAPSRFSTRGGLLTASLCWASADGESVAFSFDEGNVGVANVATQQIQPLTNSALELVRADWRFSPDAHYLVYAAPEPVAELTKVYLIDLKQPGLTRTLIDTVELAWSAALGTWSPDSSFFTYFGPSREAGRKDLEVYDVQTKRKSGTNYDLGYQQREVGFSPDGSKILYSTQWSSTTKTTELTAIAGDGGAQYFEEDAAGRPFSSVEFALDGSAALYCTTVGEEQLTDMVYSDRRVPTQSVRVPGDGSVYSCGKGFGATSKGFAYYRFAPDGARSLYWIDITRQIMSKPTKISGEGRVAYYFWQPVANAR